MVDSEKQKFKIDDFEGPLDLLLFLIKKNEINIYDIPIAQITEQYLDILSLSSEVDLDSATEFYQMAATLLYLKSKTLLPYETEEEEDWEDSRQALIEKLIEYQKYKKLAEMLAENEPKTDWVFDRKKPQAILPFDRSDEFWEKMEVWDLFQTFSKIMKNLSPQRVINLYEEVSVNEKITLVYEYLDKKEPFAFTDLITNPESLMDIVCSFLAILEMVKSQRIVLFQSRLYGDIQIRGVEEKISE